MTLFAHQLSGISFLSERSGALLAYDMGTGKSRTALHAARKLYDRPANAKNRIDRVLVLCPASVRYSWREELTKLSNESASFPSSLLAYDPKSLTFKCAAVLGTLNGNVKCHMPVAVVSYALLQQKRHQDAIAGWCASGETVLIADESSFIKTRTAKQTKGAKSVASVCKYRWLLSGTPVTNSPLDLWAQADVMYPLNRGEGPLHGFTNFYAFRAAYAELQTRHMGRATFQEVTGYKNIDKLQKRFAPFVSRVEKKDCLDLPPKLYSVREVQLSAETWKLYCELKKDCLLTLGDGDVRPEPNAAVRLLRLCQITSGHVGRQEVQNSKVWGLDDVLENQSTDISSEKLQYLVESLTEGELAEATATSIYLSNTYSATDRAQSEDRTHRPATKFINGTIVWCRWRRERERLAELLKSKLVVYQIFGGQSKNERERNISGYVNSESERAVCIAQPASGGYGLNLQSVSDKVSYVDVLATGPDGQKTVDHVVLEALRAKADLASWTCSAWRKALDQ